MWKCSVKFNALGGTMFTPVLLFPFAGIVVGLAILLQNPDVCRESLTHPNSLFAQIVHIIEEGGWTVFRNMPLIFAVGLPIGLAKQAQARGLAAMVSFLPGRFHQRDGNDLGKATSASISLRTRWQVAV